MGQSYLMIPGCCLLNLATENVSVDFRVQIFVVVSCALLQSCSCWLPMDVLKIISHRLVYFFFLFFKFKLRVSTAVWTLQYCGSAIQLQHRKFAIALYHIHTSTQSSRKVLVFPHCTKMPYTCFKNSACSDLQLICMTVQREKFNCMQWTNLVWACKMHLLGTMFLRKPKYTHPPSPANKGRKCL